METARHLLEHSNINIGLRENGEWTVFYSATCRFLDPSTSKCTIHGTARQPQICKDYRADRCWYRRTFAAATTNEMIFLSRSRVSRLIEMCIFDDCDEIYRVPDWERMSKELAGVDARALPAAALPAPGGASVAPDPRDLLLFPPGRPTHLRHLDLIRFRLGFPGVSLRIAGDEWAFAAVAPRIDCGPRCDGISQYHVPSEPAADAGEPYYVTLEGLPQLIDELTVDEEGAIISGPRRPSLPPSRSPDSPPDPPPARRRAA